MAKESGSILVIDDEQGMRDFLSIYLKKQGYDVISAPNGGAGIHTLEKTDFDLVITDLQMPDITGIDVLKFVKEHHPETEVVIITAYATPETGVEAMKVGALDYITKPFNLDQVKIVIDKVFKQQGLVRENTRLKKDLSSRYGISNIIGKSEGMQQVFEMVEKVADLDSTILITGESGTGKELVARAIHNSGPRKDRPFVACNCGAFPETLLESELFGHEKGAFTGASHKKVGLIEEADTGTLFLDEIGETSLPIQVKFLRFIQEKYFRRVGGSKDIPVDERIISATNRNLEDMVRDGTFREDLYYRLNVIQIRIPPLRERPDDIVLLVKHFLEKYCTRHRREMKVFTPQAMDCLQRYRWPGNVRQLENFIEQIVVLQSNNEVREEDLPSMVRGVGTGRISGIPADIPDEGLDFQKSVNDYERVLVEETLKKTKNDKKKAADLLKISLRSLRYQLTKHDIKTD